MDSSHRRGFMVSARAKRVSIYNNYFTFPVIALMVSNHFPSIYGHRWSWALLLVIVAAGAAVRHVLNIRFTFPAWKPALAATIVASVVALGALLSVPPASNSVSRTDCPDSALSMTMALKVATADQAGTGAARCTGFSTMGRLISAESTPNNTESHQIIEFTAFHCRTSVMRPGGRRAFLGLIHASRRLTFNISQDHVSAAQVPGGTDGFHLSTSMSARKAGETCRLG